MQNNTKEQLLRELSKLKDGHLLIDSLRENKDYAYLLNADGMTGVKAITFSKGHGPSHPDKNVDVEFDAYYERVIQPRLNSGEIGDGTKTEYDDRKLRFADLGMVPTYTFRNGILNFPIGPTDYLRSLDECKLSDDDKFSLIIRGITESSRPWKYLASPLSVSILPISKSGTAYVGKRVSWITEPGKLCNVAGNMTFHRDVEKINVYEDAQREFREELGLDLKLGPENMKFIGVATATERWNMDLGFIAELDVPDSYFTSGEWKTKIPELEHEWFIGLNKRKDLERVLREGKVPGSDESHRIIHSTRFALEYFLRKYL